jgi:protein-tyrosine phosphatase
MKIENLGLIPVRNFGIVSEKHKIYRSAQPLYRYEYFWMKERLDLQRVINIRSELHHDDTIIKRTHLNISILNIDVADHFAPSKEQADEFIRDIQRDNSPTLIHCQHGHGRTSTFSVLAKLAIGYSLVDAMVDEAERFQYHFKHKVQREFLENYSYGNS